jgi:hypothetical protein
MHFSIGKNDAERVESAFFIHAAWEKKRMGIAMSSVGKLL